MGEGKLAYLYGSGVSSVMKVRREAAGKWRSSWDSRVLRAAWLGPEGSKSREDKWEMGSLLVWFRSLMKA